MTAEWRRLAVSDLIQAKALEIGDGYRATNSELSRTGLPFARAGNIGDGFWFSDVDCFPEDKAHKLGKKISRPGDVVFTSKGTVGRFAFVKDDTPRFVYSPQLCYWRSLNADIVDARFLYYWMASHEFRSQVDIVAGQTDMAEYVNLRDQRRMRITAPPVPEQRVIAHVLGTLDDKIDLNRRMNETLEAMVRALFTSWFVDFEPVRTKMSGRDTGLQTPIDDLFPDRIVGIGNRQVPEGWRNGTVDDISLLNPESWSSKRRPEELSYVDLANTKWGYIESVESFPWEEAPSRAQRVLRRRDTIMATVRPGNGSFALVDEDGLTGSTGFAVLRPREAADRALIWCAVTSAANLARLSLLADGSAYPAVRSAEVAATPVALADFAIRAEFSSLVDPLLDKIGANKRESRHLRSLRDQLLPRIFARKSLRIT